MTANIQYLREYLYWKDEVEERGADSTPEAYEAFREALELEERVDSLLPELITNYALGSSDISIKYVFEALTGRTLAEPNADELATRRAIKAGHPSTGTPGDVA